jgi:hypothetical protein
MKRLNPKTGKPFKHAEVREDGFVFTGYSNKLRKDGTFIELWSNPEKLKNRISKRKVQENKKRINPLTGKIYKMGDSIGGKIFRSFSPSLDKDGFHKLKLITETDYKDFKKKSILTNAKYRARAKRKKLNPATGELWKKGEKNLDGLYFIGYETSADADGWHHMRFGTFEKYKKRRLQNTFKNIKDRCNKNNIPCEINVDYLISIYPKNNKCPVLDIELEFGGGLSNLRNSPSVDRIYPDKGYIKGNVIIISYFANSIKQNASAKEVMKVAKWLKKVTQ